MSILNERYRKLEPTITYLADSVVLAQAWKKSQSYIRSHNWYADTLELDCSTVNLQKLLGQWKEQLEKATYKPDSMKLVPAPKADRWSFYPNHLGEWEWRAISVHESLFKKQTVSYKELRPLAHLTIRDQTIATAIMLCLADVVESKQGSTDPEDGHTVWNYGNRLYCDWDGKSAKFRWGNNSVYSKYFQDYQRFLERPLKKAQKEQQSLMPGESLYEVHLDFSSFYDSIDRDRLIHVLKEFAIENIEKNEEADKKFWDLVESTITGWHWNEEDSKLAYCLKNEEIPVGRGVPQGLVAGGFFANAYLIELDNKLAQLIGGHDDKLSLIDYCRYVDDIRLLVKVSNVEEIDLPSWVSDKIEPIVQEIDGLTLNSSKTKVKKVLAKQSGTSTRMKIIQQAISGPQDKGAIDEILGSLDGLFTLAELFRDQTPDEVSKCDFSLAQIDKSKLDVREDTILRFAANRISLALQRKRLLVSNDSIDSDNLEELDRFCESMARRFIAVWSRNPSLVAVLKKGFGLFPHANLLQPVIDALLSKIGDMKDDDLENHLKIERRVALYCLSEIYRFATLELTPKEQKLFASNSDRGGFNKLLLRHAGQLLRSGALPWYLKQQIVLFLAVSGDRFCGVQRQDGLNGKLDNYKMLRCSLCGNHSFQSDSFLIDRVAIFVVAFQLCEGKIEVIRNLGRWLDWLYKKSKDKVEQVLDSIALNDSGLFLKIYQYSGQVKAEWYNNALKISNRYGYEDSPLPGDLNDYNGREVPLVSVIKRPDNPFAHESGLLVLAREIAPLINKEKIKGKKCLSPNFVKVECSNWSRLLSGQSGYGHNLKVRWVPGQSKDLRYALPDWILSKDDSRMLYQLGAFLRAAAIGDTDFTALNNKVSKVDIQGYWGINSSWYKRTIGMAHQPEVLVGPDAPMSSWISELLYRLLQWPGLDLYNNGSPFPLDLSLKIIRKIINQRLAVLSRLYGKASQLPVVVERVSHVLKKSNHLSIVMVQSLMPRLSDFSAEGPLLSGVDYRKKHRNHIVALSKLICEKLTVSKQAKGHEAVKPYADLIIFPELAVHPEDIDILKQLADKTGAMIFTGLTYQKESGVLLNRAFWLIPSVNNHGRKWVARYQGKRHPTKDELKIGVKPWRPYQLIVELENSLLSSERGFRLSGAICYDSTDLNLAADLRDHINSFIVVALNKDIETFDTMVDALHYHMFQPVILVNSGEFGGSAAKAPYKEKYEKRIAHVHGGDQISISMFEINMHDFDKNYSSPTSGKELKTKPAGMS